MQFQLVVCFFALAMGAETAAELARIRLAQTGLDYAATVVQNTLNTDSNIAGTEIPGQKSGKFTFHGGRITHFTAPTLRLISVAPNKLRFTSTGGALGAEGKGRYRQNRVLKISASARASASNLNLDLELGLSRNNAGKLQLTPGRCHANIANLSVKISGNIIVKIVNLFRKMIADKIKKILNDRLCAEMSAIIVEKGNPWLATADMSIPVSDDTKLVLSLAKDPAMTAQYFDVSFDGGVQQGTSPVQPIPSPPLPASTLSSNMVYFWLSSAALNGAFTFAQQQDLLQYRIDKESLSENHQEKLRTTCDGGILPPKCIGAVLPKLAQTFPDTSVYFAVKTREAPSITIESGSVSIGLKAEVAVKVENPANADAFKAHLDFKSAISVRVQQIGDKHVVFGELLPRTGEIKLEILESHIGGFPTDVIQAIIDFGEPIFLYFFNKELKKGFELPTMPNVELVTPNLAFETGALRVESSVIYRP